MCWHPYFHSLIFLCPTHEPNLGFGCAHLCIFLYSKTIIHQFFLINKQTQKQHVHTAPFVMMLSLPFSSACWSSSGQLVSAALYWEQMPHQVPVPAGHTALLATAATANQKALLPGQSLMEQAWRDMLSVRLGAPGCPMQCLLCFSTVGRAHKINTASSWHKQPQWWGVD